MSTVSSALTLSLHSQSHYSNDTLSLDSYHQSGTSSSVNLGLLIYAHHNNRLKNFTRKEQQQIFKTLPTLIQENIQEQIIPLEPISGIYINNSEDTVSIYTITLEDMQALRPNIEKYRQVTERTLNYTLALLTDIHTHITSASQLTEIPFSKSFISFIDQQKAFIMSSSPPKHKCVECSLAYRTKSSLARHRKKRHPNKHSNSIDSTEGKETYLPPILSDINCPATYTDFFQMKAKTRQLPPNNKKNIKFVAPRYPLTMLQLAEEVNFPDLLSKEFEAYAHSYDHIVKLNNFASINTVPFYSVGVINSEHDLSLTGKTRILESLKKKAPQLEPKILSKLTEAKLMQFFFLARTFMLTSSIPTDSFSDYFLTKAVLGHEIYSKVTNALSGYPTHKQLLKNFTCFIERIILRLLPVQESYYDAEVRILKKHKQYLTGPNPCIDYTRTYVQSDAQDLTTKSPYYKQVHKDITDEQHRMMVENEKTNLLHKILAHTRYDAEIHKLLIGSDKYQKITDIPNNELLDNLQSLMVADRKAAKALVNAT